MRAMLLEGSKRSLALRDVPLPKVGSGQVLVRITACAICRTDLHVIDGELPHPKLPLIPGHEIVGRIEMIGDDVGRFCKGDRVGIPWLGWTCGACPYCRSERENLCDHARFTGYTIDGGFAEYTVADARFCFSLPDSFSDVNAAPLLCAGLIGYRSLRMTKDARRLGIFGFGAAAHIVSQIACFQGREVFAFTRPGKVEAQEFARGMGAVWAGGSNENSPVKLDAAIIFAPFGELIPLALKAIRKGGDVICGGIHMSDIPSFPYRYLWEERTLSSVANLTRRDGEEFFDIASRVPIRTQVETFPLDHANDAIEKLRSGAVRGAAVLVNE